MVFAKAPVPGSVKTRMTPPLEPAEAAELYAAMLDDVLEATARAAGELDLTPVLAVHPPESLARVAERAPAAFRVVEQRGADLGARMGRAVDEAGAAGAGLVLIRGSDSPALGVATLSDACLALASADLVVSGDPDGGYNLVGVREPIPGLFRHRMSASSSLAELCRNADARGLRVKRLAPGFDLDTVGDFARLREARDRGDTQSCPRTLAYLDAHALWSLAAPPR